MGCLICGLPVTGRGLCKSHYYKARRRGDLDGYQTKVDAGTSKADLEERLLSKIEKTDTCWNWTGAIVHGYGAIQMWPLVKRAHRVSFEHFVGPIPKGKLLRHTCDNKRCVNPAHLLVGTKADNGRDMVERGQFKPNAKLSEDQVRKIRADTRPQADIAAEHGVSVWTISAIKTGLRWARI